MSQMSALTLHENMEREQFGGYNPDDQNEEKANRKVFNKMGVCEFDLICK